VYEVLEPQTPQQSASPIHPLMVKQRPRKGKRFFLDHMMIWGQCWAWHRSPEPRAVSAAASELKHRGEPETNLPKCLLWLACSLP
jgi:hypothetical protein